MYKTIPVTILIIFLVLVTGCASLKSEFKEPTVSVISFRALPSRGMAPSFEIGLHVTNPNRFSLALAGVSYTVSIEGREIVTGVANDLPEIEAYGEGDITLQATADIVNSIGLLADLVKQPRDTFAFELDALLDLGGIYPDLHVNKKGKISLAPIQG